MGEKLIAFVMRAMAMMVLLIAASAFTETTAHAALFPPDTAYIARGGLSQSRVEAIYANKKDGSHFFNFNGYKIHYRIRGEGRPVLFIHGIMDSLHTWSELSEVLEPDMQVISMDLPGFGLSDALPASDDIIADFHWVIEALVAHLGLTDYTLVGHSLGGLTAWTYAIDHPEVRDLILIGSAGYKQKLPPVARLGRRTSKIILNLFPYPMMEHLLTWAFYWDFKLDILGTGGWPQNVLAKSRRMVRLFLSQGNVDSYLYLLSHLRKYKFQHAHRVPEIKQPVLFIIGKQDDTVAYKKNIKLWKRDLPEAKFVELRGVGHLPHWESTDKVAQEITEFVKAVP